VQVTRQSLALGHDGQFLRLLVELRFLDGQRRALCQGRKEPKFVVAKGARLRVICSPRR
jgi:hypothetical protein